MSLKMKSLTLYLSHLHGVLQNSAFGPALDLFLININDIYDTTKSKVRIYLDEVAIYLAVSSLEDAQIMKQGLDLLNQLEPEWDMECNPSRCVKYTLQGKELQSLAS